MKVVIQRASKASIIINHDITKVMGPGYVVLLGVEEADNSEDVDWLVSKISKLRVFSDDQGKMNLSIGDIGGSVMIVSQFTLHASTKKGNRPSFIRAAKPAIAIPLYEEFILKTERIGLDVLTGEFGADMQVSLTNDGPVTIIIDSKNRV